MDEIVKLIIYAGILIVGIICSIFLFKIDKEGMFKFITWFVCSLVISFLVLDLVSNPFTLSLIIACVIGFMAVKDGN